MKVGSLAKRVYASCYLRGLLLHCTDTNLQELLKKLTDSLPSISDVTTIESALSYTSNLVAIHVGETLLKNNALLLPEVNELFHNRLQEVLLLPDRIPKPAKLTFYFCKRKRMLHYIQ